MSDIEDTIEQIIASIMIGEPIKLPFLTRKLVSTQQHKKRKEDASPSISEYNEEEANGNNVRYLSLSSASSTKALARYISVLQMIYEAVAYKIMVTKRDMFYRDVPLFGTQAVVDIIVDDISCHFNVPRSSLNVSAASKGLVFGPIRIKLKNNKMMDCMSIHQGEECHDEQGTLIPPINQILEIQCKANCMIVIEKEATFRYLVSIGFCESLPQSCVLVTGKGYPDLCTRQFVKYFLTCYRDKPILALMDNDPHGLDIYATYKWGARVYTICARTTFTYYLYLYLSII
ncbi:MAG: Spo11/DNA topoisomerase VI subunit A [Benjaminiella poitrasii]|nr:MAG: Spo11/DNA topoisomerase VI subunit A [Benjaminiella poitrasii]